MYSIKSCNICKEWNKNSSGCWLWTHLKISWNLDWGPRSGYRPWSHGKENNLYYETVAYEDIWCLSNPMRNRSIYLISRDWFCKWMRTLVMLPPVLATVLSSKPDRLSVRKAMNVGVSYYRRSGVFRLPSEPRERCYRHVGKFLHIWLSASAFLRRHYPARLFCHL